MTVHGGFLVDKSKAAVAEAPAGDAARLWPLLLVVGLVLAIAGVSDVALFWYPPRLGEADWEFGIIAQSMDALPLGTMGLTLMASAALLRGGRPWLLRVFVVAFAVLALCVIGCGVIWALDVPQALKAMQNPQLAPGLKRVLAKTSLLLLSYAAAYVAAAMLLWRTSRPLRVPPAS